MCVVRGHLRMVRGAMMPAQVGVEQIVTCRSVSGRREGIASPVDRWDLGLLEVLRNWHLPSVCLASARIPPRADEQQEEPRYVQQPKKTGEGFDDWDDGWE
jgi:hypothetical protein